MGFLRWARDNKALFIGCFLVGVGIGLHNEETWGVGLLLMLIAAFS